MLNLLLFRLRRYWHLALLQMVVTGIVIAGPWGPSPFALVMGWPLPFGACMMVWAIPSILSGKDDRDFGKRCRSLPLPVSRRGFLASRLLFQVIAFLATLAFAVLLNLTERALLPGSPGDSVLTSSVLQGHIGFMTSWWLVDVGIFLVREVLESATVGTVLGFLPFLAGLTAIYSPLGGAIMELWAAATLPGIPWFPAPACLAFALAAGGLAFGLNGRRLAGQKRPVPA